MTDSYLNSPIYQQMLARTLMQGQPQSQYPLQAVANTGTQFIQALMLRQSMDADKARNADMAKAVSGALQPEFNQAQVTPAVAGPSNVSGATPMNDPGRVAMNAANANNGADPTPKEIMARLLASGNADVQAQILPKMLDQVLTPKTPIKLGAGESLYDPSTFQPIVQGRDKLNFVNGQGVDPYSGQPMGAPIPQQAPQPQAAMSPERFKQQQSLQASGAAATANAAANAGPQPTPAEIDPQSGSILAQTGLSLPAFYAITGDASKLPRDKVSRTRAFQEAQDFANKRGVDVSTLASQYQAYNDTLQANIKRVNQTKIMEGELDGTIQNLQPVADAAKMGNLRIGNVAKLFAGQETNDPVVSQYAFQLNQLRAELAGYNAAIQGRTGSSITQQDMQEAERVIKDGLSSKSADGLQKSVASATEKMTGVLHTNIDNSQKALWDLFGVGNNYKEKYPQPKPVSKDATDALLKKYGVP